MHDLKMFIYWIVTVWQASTIIQSSYASVIPAAIIRKHTITYKDVPVYNKPVTPQMILVPASIANLYVHFRTKSSQVHVRQQHRGAGGHTQHSTSQDEPHYLRHEIKKPVIQTVREVIVPYRQVIQEIKPVVEEVKTVVSAKDLVRAPAGQAVYPAVSGGDGGGAKSSMYMTFGTNKQPDYKDNDNNQYVNSVYNTHQSNGNGYGYVLTAQHPPAYAPASGYAPTSGYTTGADGVYGGYYTYQTSSPQTDTKKYAYDLSTIYGINPASLSSYGQHVEDKQPVYEQAVPVHHQPALPAPQSAVQVHYQPSPIVYGVAEPLQQTTGYSVNQIHSKPQTEYSVSKPYSVVSHSGGSGDANGYHPVNDYGKNAPVYGYATDVGAGGSSAGLQQHQAHSPQYTPVSDDAYYGQSYNYVPQSEQHYYVNHVKNTVSDNNYYAQPAGGLTYAQPASGLTYAQTPSEGVSAAPVSGYDRDAHYVTLDLVNTGYHTDHGYAQDLATSDEYGHQLDYQGNGAGHGTLYGQYAQDQLSKATSLGSLAQIVSALQQQQHHYDGYAYANSQQPLQTYKDAAA